MILHNYKIVKLDDRNITFYTLKKMKSKEPNSMDKLVWRQSGFYYGTVVECLEGIKNQIVSGLIDHYDPTEFIQQLEALQNAIVQVRLLSEEPPHQII